MSDLCYLPAVTLAQRIRERSLGVRELTTAVLDRIERYNPQLTAVVSLRDPEEILAEADQLDLLAPKGPLHGLPIAIKDLANVKGLPTRAGSVVTSERPQQRDDLFVQRIRDAGALIIGKTNTPEFGAGSHTFNEVFGTTRNPHRRDKSAGGSSGGAAAALAAGLLPIADGSDFGGSLRNPAAWCGVVGFRPSIGRVPAVPADDLFINRLGLAGPMGRTVDDVQLLLTAMAGPDPRDPLSLLSPQRLADPLGGDLSGVRVAWLGDLGLPWDRDAWEVPLKAVDRFVAAGGSVSDVDVDFSGVMDAFRILRGLAFRRRHGQLPSTALSKLKQTLRDNIAYGMGISVDDIDRAEATRTRLHLAMTELFATYDIAALPTTQVGAFDADVEYPTEVGGQPMEDYLEWMSSCCVITLTGCPTISMPAGVDDNGVPLGIQLIGPVGSEHRLLDIAKGFENATGDLRRRPTLMAAD